MSLLSCHDGAGRCPSTQKALPVREVCWNEAGATCWGTIQVSWMPNQVRHDTPPLFPPIFKCVRPAVTIAEGIPHSKCFVCAACQRHPEGRKYLAGLFLPAPALKKYCQLRDKPGNIAIPFIMQRAIFVKSVPGYFFWLCSGSGSAAAFDGIRRRTK